MKIPSITSSQDEKHPVTWHHTAGDDNRRLSEERVFTYNAFSGIHDPLALNQQESEVVRQGSVNLANEDELADLIDDNLLKPDSPKFHPVNTAPDSKSELISKSALQYPISGSTNYKVSLFSKDKKSANFPGGT